MTTLLENDHLSIGVSSAGAELTSIFNKKRQQEFLWQGHAQWWPRRAPVLFPIVGKLNQNSYRVHGTTFTLPQHGFARDSEFAWRDSSTDSVSLELKSGDETRARFPFDFSLMISYHLHGGTLTTQYTIRNTGSSLLPFSIGAHPGFAFSAGETLSDYYIEFEKPEKLSRHLIQDGVFTGETEPVLDGKILPISDDLMKKDAIVFKDMKSDTLVLKSRISDYCLKFHAAEFPYFGIWAKPGGPFVCLEPWCGLADNQDFRGDLSEKEGINILQPGETFVRGYAVTPG